MKAKCKKRKSNWIVKDSDAYYVKYYYVSYIKNSCYYKNYYLIKNSCCYKNYYLMKKLLFTKIPNSKNSPKKADTNKNHDKKFLLYFIEQLHVLEQTE